MSYMKGVSFLVGVSFYLMVQDKLEFNRKIGDSIVVAAILVLTGATIVDLTGPTNTIVQWINKTIAERGLIR